VILVNPVSTEFTSAEWADQIRGLIAAGSGAES
jgi:hypothetical protein